MGHRTNLLMATALALPLGFGAMAANAADVVETLRDHDRFSNFVEAIEAAGLDETLTGEGPFTVFAPTNDAFDQLPENVVEALKEEDYREQLEALLRAHVVEGEEITVSDIRDADDRRMEIEPMEGEAITLHAPEDEDDDVRIELAGVESEDRIGAPGAAAAAPPAPVTDQQQAATGPAMTPQPPAAAPGAAPMGQPPATVGADVTAPTGPTVTAEAITPGATLVPTREARIVEADIEADNGIIHAIDTVLVSPDAAEQLREIRQE